MAVIINFWLKWKTTKDGKFNTIRKNTTKKLWMQNLVYQKMLDLKTQTKRKKKHLQVIQKNKNMLKIY